MLWLRRGARLRFGYGNFGYVFKFGYVLDTFENVVPNPIHLLLLLLLLTYMQLLVFFFGVAALKRPQSQDDEKYLIFH